MRLLFTFLFALLSAVCAFGQLGCTEPCAINYNPDATVDDGSCELPEEPDVECWQTATFNDLSCLWDVVGELPVIDDSCQYTDDSFDAATCIVVNTPNCPPGTLLDAENCQCVTEEIEGCTNPCAVNYDPNANVDDGSCILPEEPVNLECYEVVTFNNSTCTWDIISDVIGTPIVECWQTATFNGDPAVCAWEVMGEMPEIDDNCEFTNDSFDEETCMTVHIPNCPDGTGFDAANCDCVMGATGGCTDPCATNYDPAATIDDGSCILPEEPTDLECYEVVTFNTATCQWDITSDTVDPPTGLECWQVAVFNGDPAVCDWEVFGEMSEQPTVACWETTSFNITTCQWDITFIGIEAPVMECWQTSVFDNATCEFAIIGEMPEIDDNCDLTDDSFDDATCTTVHIPNCPDGTGFDAANCDCVVGAIGGCTEPCAINYDPDADVDNGLCELPEFTYQIECYETAIFNTTTCEWEVVGLQPEEPNVECWEIAFFIDAICQWTVSGEQPEEPDTECYETAIFNDTSGVCAWEVQSNEPVSPPSTECYETWIFDDVTCEFIIIGEMPEVDDGCDLTDDSFDDTICEVINEPNCPTSLVFDAENCECVVYGGIQNFTFYDENQNQIQDNGEPFMSIPLILNSNDLSIFTNNENLYILEPGNYTVSIDTGTEWMLTTDSTSYSITVNVNDTIPVHFGLYPSALNSDVQTTVYALWPRCNELYTIDVNTKNIGTTLASGTTWFQMDTAIVDFTFIHQPDVVDNNTFPTSYGWNFTNLYPSETATWQVEILVPGPPDFAVGDFLLLESLTEYTDANGAHIEQGVTCGGEVRCSYDPNDKLVNPSRPYDEVLFGEDFIYTIRFQNTGNDVAYNVTILDTLDTNLDSETFRVLGSSHSEVLNTSLDNEGILTFDFPNIFLPDSTSNLEGSNGHVTYMISALDGLAENTVINNSAGIYFDQNPPIITNTTESVMVSMLTMPIECAEDELEVEVIISTDNFGSETSWEIIDSLSGEVYQRVIIGTYANFLDTTYIHNFCIPQSSCATFNIKDDYGDGICCAYGEGSYQIILESDTVAIGGNFEEIESITVHCDSTLISIESPSLFSDLIISPNPNTGTFQVENIPRGTYNLLNTKGQIIQSGQVENGTLIDISEAAQGVYFIQMMIDEQMVTRRVVKL